MASTDSNCTKYGPRLSSQEVYTHLTTDGTYLVAIKGFETDDFDFGSVGNGSEDSGYQSGDGEAEDVEEDQTIQVWRLDEQDSGDHSGDGEAEDVEKDQTIQVWRLDEPNRIHTSANVIYLQERHNREFDAVTTICMSKKGEYIAFGTSGGKVWIAHVSGLNEQWTIIDWDGSDPIWQVCLLTCGTTANTMDVAACSRTMIYHELLELDPIKPMDSTSYKISVQSKDLAILSCQTPRTNNPIDSQSLFIGKIQIVTRGNQSWLVAWTIPLHRDDGRSDCIVKYPLKREWRASPTKVELVGRCVWDTLDISPDGLILHYYHDSVSVQIWNSAGERMLKTDQHYIGNIENNDKASGCLLSRKGLLAVVCAPTKYEELSIDMFRETPEGYIWKSGGYSWQGDGDESDDLIWFPILCAAQNYIAGVHNFRGQRGARNSEVFSHKLGPEAMQIGPENDTLHIGADIICCKPSLVQSRSLQTEIMGLDKVPPPKPNIDVLVSQMAADLYTYVQEDQVFNLQYPSIRINSWDQGDGQIWFQITHGEDELLRQPFAKIVWLRLNYDYLTFMFSSKAEDLSGAWLIRFNSKGDMEDFSGSFRYMKDRCTPNKDYNRDNINRLLET